MAESFLGCIELELESVRRLPQIVAPLDRSLREGRIGKMLRIMNLSAILLSTNFAIQILSEQLISAIMI